MNDISFFKPDIGQDEINEVVDCLKSGWLTTGKRCHAFEDNFARYMGRERAVAVNSCTAALHLALEVMGVQERDVVLVPTMTFAATAEVVRYFNAIPLLVDCKEDDFNIDFDHAEALLTKIQAGERVPGLPENHGPVTGIIPVHYGGQAVDSAKLKALRAKYKLFNVEDCAHCCPAWYTDDDGQRKMVGSTADVACYSFYANKTITTGEGGMALTDNHQWADRMRVMSLHGISKDAWKRFTKAGSWYYEITAPGYKYNMTDVAAAIGVHQLTRADQFWERRKEIARRYSDNLAGVSGIVTPQETPGKYHSWHLYELQVIEADAGIHRNAFIERLKENGIGSSVHYTPLHLHPYYAENFGLKPEDFPVATRLFERNVSLPIYPLMSDADVDRVCEVIKAAVNSN